MASIVGAPDRQPGIDYISGSGVGPFIDTGRDIIFGERNLGRIYLSKDTVREYAQMFGLLGNGVGEEALQNAYIQGKLDGLRETLGGDLVLVSSTLRRWLDELDRSADLAAADATAALAVSSR